MTGELSKNFHGVGIGPLSKNWLLSSCVHIKWLFIGWGNTFGYSIASKINRDSALENSFWLQTKLQLWTFQFWKTQTSWIPLFKVFWYKNGLVVVHSFEDKVPDKVGSKWNVFCCNSLKQKGDFWFTTSIPATLESRVRNKRAALLFRTFSYFKREEATLYLFRNNKMPVLHC